MSTDTEAALDAAIRAHAIDVDGIDVGQVIVGWTLVGQAVDPDVHRGNRIFYFANADLDPILELGLLTTRHADALAWCSRDEGDE